MIYPVIFKEMFGVEFTESTMLLCAYLDPFFESLYRYKLYASRVK